jgi:two-component system, sensor histidine kinase and response regulator
MIFPNAPMTGSYSYLQVALSALIAVSASYAALDLAGRVTAASGWVRSAWLTGGATAMGIGIWAMHFVGMVAFSLPVPVAYHWPTVLVALLAAIFASTFALYVVSRHKMGLVRASTGSIIMGSGVAGMHYIGMAAMRFAAVCRFDPLLVTLSVTLAIAFSLAALLLAFDLREESRGTIPRKITSALVMGTAVCAMHYTGMASASFVPTAVLPDLSHAISVSTLGTAGFATVTLIVLGLAILSSSVDRRFDAQGLELALAEAKAELAHVSRIATMGELTASIAHEINQPLAAIIVNGSASLRWLGADPPNLEEARQAMTRAVREANRAGEVIGGIRNLLKKDSPKMKQLDVNQIIEEVLALTENQLRKAGVTVHTELAADVPGVLGDRVQLQQVILNLIMNSIDAMRTITDRPRKLLIKSTKGPEGVLIQVEDSGIGLDPERAARIFEPFFTTKPQGIGMGLSISRSIIESHGGRLWAVPGSSGALFQFTLLTRASRAA